MDPPGEEEEKKKKQKNMSIGEREKNTKRLPQQLERCFSH